MKIALTIAFALDFTVTSRPQREYEDNGKNYWFLDREDMEKQIKQHKFLEYGEHNGNIYGTSLDSIRNVINEGKMCVLDCSPSVSERADSAYKVQFFSIFMLVFLILGAENFA